MKILVLSYFFRPDLSAGSFRSAALIESLKKNHPNVQVEVITSRPNRYKGFTDECASVEEDGNVTIYRADVNNKYNGMVGQIISFVLFFFFAFKMVKGKRYDVIYATSSRLMTAFLGAMISLVKRVPLYLDIRDIFIDTLEDVFPKKINFFVLPMLYIVEKFTINKASKVNLVSEGFLPYFHKKYPKQNYSVHTNGIDPIFLDEFNKENQEGMPQQKNMLTVVYAGNFGDGQGLHKIIPALAHRLGERVHFQLIGDGGRKKELIQEIEKLSLQNVELIAPVNRNVLLNYYRNADVLFLHLNDYDAFKKVIPSKIFEYACFSKPILGGLSGYIVDFIGNNISDAYIFHPCDVDEAVARFNELSLNVEKRVFFVQSHTRENIMGKLSDDIFTVLGN